MQLSLFYDYQSLLASSSFYRKYDAIFQAVELAIASSPDQKAAFGRKGAMDLLLSRNHSSTNIFRK